LQASSRFTVVVGLVRTLNDSVAGMPLTLVEQGQHLLNDFLTTV